MMKCKMLLMALFFSFSLMATPKAVIFDFGGVMTAAPDKKGLQQFLIESLSLSKEDFKRIYQVKKIANAQGVDDVSFFKDYAEKNHLKLSPSWKEEFYAAMKKSLNVRSEMYELVERIKEKDLLVGLFSNIDERRASLLREWGLYACFSPCILSYEIGCEKPDPKAYKILLEVLDVEPQEVLFIDDKEQNVHAAKELGIDAVLFENTDQVQRELKKRNAL